MDERKVYERAFDGVEAPDRLRERIIEMSEGQTRPPHFVRRLSTVAAAAVLLLFLLGCAVVGTVYGQSIQSWFAHYWQAVNHQAMSEGQTAMIDHLTQEIHQSQTVDGVTVTVDSATVGDDNFFLLLRVEGADFSKRWGYRFEEMTMEFSPDPTEADDGLGGYGFQYQGLDGDGSALMLMDMGYASSKGFQADTSPLEVTLTLTDLVESGGSHEELLTQGTWSFAFTLDRSQIPAPVSLPDTSIEVMDRSREHTIQVELTNLQVTNTGARFQYSPSRAAMDELRVTLILKNETEIRDGGSFGTGMEDGDGMFVSYQWSVPADLEEAAALRIGDVEIPIP